MGRKQLPRENFVFVQEKKCSKCKEIKDRSLFSSNKIGVTGIASQCRLCKNESYKSSEAYLECQKRAYAKAKLPENKERLKGYAKKSYLKNKTKKATYHRERRLNNIDFYLELEQQKRDKRREKILYEKSLIPAVIITHKTCTTCKEHKELDSFHASTENKSTGKCAVCKDCKKQDYVDRKIKYELETGEAFLDKIKRVNANLPIDVKKAKSKKVYQKNKVANTERSKEWIKNNRERYLATLRARQKKLKSENPLYKLKSRLCGAVSKAFASKGQMKNVKSLQILGAELDVIKKHIERQFKKGMTWKNHKMDGWHIDHIIPLSSAKNEQDLYSLCHYTNLQPMWAKENIKKGGKIPPVQTKLRL